MIILRPTDRVAIDIEGVRFVLAPLTVEQQQRIEACVKIESGKRVPESAKMLGLAVKYSVKDVSGLETLDGKPYRLSFDENGYLSDECVNELVLLSIGGSLSLACHQIRGGLEALKRVPGVKLQLGKSEVPVKKKRSPQAR